jgi:hypothetical protein
LPDLLQHPGSRRRAKPVHPRRQLNPARLPAGWFGGGNANTKLSEKALGIGVGYVFWKEAVLFCKKAPKNSFESGPRVLATALPQPMTQIQKVFLLLFVHKKKFL